MMLAANIPPVPPRHALASQARMNLDVEATKQKIKDLELLSPQELRGGLSKLRYISHTYPIWHCGTQAETGVLKTLKWML